MKNVSTCILSFLFVFAYSFFVNDLTTIPTAQAEEKPSLTLETLRAAGAVRIGYANENPFGYRDNNGFVTGEGPEVARHVFSALGVPRVIGVETEFGSLIRDLHNGRFDVIAAGMFIMPDRCQQIIFSEPSYKAKTAFLVRRGNPLRLHSYEDIGQNIQNRIGVVAGSAELSFAKASNIPDSQIVLFPTPQTAAAAVSSGSIAAYAALDITVQRLAEKNTARLESATPFESPDLGGTNATGYGAFGFRAQDTALRDAFNNELMRFLGTSEHIALITPFGFTKSAIPDKTMAELCAR